jgi:sec-independent protein translocase protein TatC
MFYIKELIFRVQYFLLSLSLTLILCYVYRNLLLYLLTFSVLSTNNNSNISGVDYFIYTHPSELLTIYFLVVLYFSGLFLFPFCVWNFLDFLKSSLLSSEYYFLLQLILFLILIISFSNIFCFLNLFPTFWTFFESFNNLSNKINDELNFFLELRIQDYFLFLSSFLYLINICLFFLLFICLFFSLYGIKTLLHWKKLFIFFNIVFATLLSPPDVYSQLLIFVTLTVIFEIIIFFYIFYYKICKYIKLS